VKGCYKSGCVQEPWYPRIPRIAHDTGLCFRSGSPDLSCQVQATSALQTLHKWTHSPGLPPAFPVACIQCARQKAFGLHPSGPVDHVLSRDSVFGAVPSHQSDLTCLHPSSPGTHIENFVSGDSDASTHIDWDPRDERAHAASCAQARQPQTGTSRHQASLESSRVSCDAPACSDSGFYTARSVQRFGEWPKQPHSRKLQAPIVMSIAAALTEGGHPSGPHTPRTPSRGSAEAGTPRSDMPLHPFEVINAHSMPAHHSSALWNSPISISDLTDVPAEVSSFQRVEQMCEKCQHVIWPQQTHLHLAACT
jgi:hypothetical protein